MSRENEFSADEVIAAFRAAGPDRIDEELPLEVLSEARRLLDEAARFDRWAHACRWIPASQQTFKRESERMRLDALRLVVQSPHERG